MLTSRTAVKLSMRIAATDTSKDNLIDSLIGGVDSLIKTWCGRNLERVVACSAPSGVAVAATPGGSLTNSQAYFWKITALNQNGETTPSAEVTITATGPNLTGYLTWQQVTGAIGYKIYRGTTSGGQNKLITTLPSGSIVNYSDTGVTGETATVPSSNTATAGLVEYLSGTNTTEVCLREVPLKVSDITAVYLDSNGLFGQGVNAFASTTQLTAGSNYFLRVDQPDGVTSRSGILERIGGVWPGSVNYSPGRLSATMRPGRGNIKAVYNGGFPPGSVPPEISGQANNMIARLIKMGAGGFLASSESFEDRSVSIDLGPYANMLFTPEAVVALLPYRMLRP